MSIDDTGGWGENKWVDQRLCRLEQEQHDKVAAHSHANVVTVQWSKMEQLAGRREHNDAGKDCPRWAATTDHPDQVRRRPIHINCSNAGVETGSAEGTYLDQRIRLSPIPRSNTRPTQYRRDDNIGD